MSDLERSYNSGEIEQILMRAMELQQGEALSRSQLEEMALELGILPETLDAAEAKWRHDLKRKQARQALKSRFKVHAIAYLAVNAFLFAIDLSSGGLNWAFWPLLGWGLGLVMHAIALYGIGGDRPG